MFSTNKIKRELLDQGHDQAIDGILRSNDSENDQIAVEKALKILNDPVETKKIAKRLRRESQRISPESSAIQTSIEIIQNSTLTKIASAILPLAAALVFFLLYQIYTQPSQLSGTPKITYTDKSISLIRNNKIIPAKLQMEILNLDSITIPYGQKITITYNDGSSLDLLSNSTTSFGLKIINENKNHLNQKLIELKHGEIKVNVAKQQSAFPMLLRTDYASIKVVGTKFRLSNNKNKTVLQMKKGIVEFTNLTTNKSIEVKNSQTAFVFKNTISIETPAIKPIKKRIPRITEDCLVSYNFNKENLIDNDTIKNNFPTDKSINLTASGISKPQMLKKGGLNIISQTSLTNKKEAEIILNKIKESNQFSLELWIKPTNNKSGNDHSTLIAASKDKALFGQPLWLFFLGQKEKDLVMLINTELGDDVDKQLEFKDIFSNTSTIHLVITKNENGIVTLFKNGIEQESMKIKGNLTNWFSDDDNVRLDLAGNNTRSHFWSGIYYLAAIYNRALNKEEIQNNFQSKY